jgi:hypothetical protein
MRAISHELAAKVDIEQTRRNVRYRPKADIKQGVSS